MGLTLEQYRQYTPGYDEYAKDQPNLKLDDLKLRQRSTTPKISYLISTWNRHAQLSRSLECLARQTMDDFEVLLANDGSTQNITEVVEPFKPYLNITR